MALTAAEKQKRYRQRKARAGSAGTPVSELPRKVAVTTSKTTRSRAAKAAPIGTTLEECEKNVLRLQHQAEAAAADPECSHQGRASIGNAVKAALSQLATLRGEDELSAQRILRSQAFSGIREAMKAIAEECPGPWVRKLADRLEALP